MSLDLFKVFGFRVLNSTFYNASFQNHPRFGHVLLFYTVKLKLIHNDVTDLLFRCALDDNPSSWTCFDSNQTLCFQ